MTNQVSIFLTPKQSDPAEAQVVAFPDEVTLFIDVDVDENGNQTVTNIDDVVWQYFKEPPQAANMAAFPNSPEPANVTAEVRLAPLNTPFAPPPSTTSSLLPEADTSSYENVGINPLVPNKPRPDAAPEPEDQLPLGEGVVSGNPREYKYAVILTSQNQVYTLDPKLFIIRRHRRSTHTQ